MTRGNLIDAEVIYQHQTEKAVCVREVEGGPDIWLPLAQVEIEAKDGEPRRGGIVTLTAPDWLLIDKGLM